MRFGFKPLLVGEKRRVMTLITVAEEIYSDPGLWESHLERGA